MTSIKDYMKSRNVLEFKARRHYTLDPEDINPGDRLRIKSDLSGFDKSDGVPFINGIHIWSSMNVYLGETVTVKRIFLSSSGEYVVQVYGIPFYWPFEIFELP